MNNLRKLFSICCLAYGAWLTAQPAQAQALAKHEAWLQQQFKQLIVEEKDTPTFTFRAVR